MEGENLELSDYEFFYNGKIEENGNGIIYQKVDKDVMSTNQQIQMLYKEIQNIIPSISFQLKFKNDIFEDMNDENYYIDIQYYNNISQKTQQYIENQLITHVIFTKVNI